MINGARSADERVVVDALVEISSSLYVAQHVGRATASRGDIYVLDQVVAAVRAISDALAERFALPAVRMAATSPLHGRREPRTATITHLLWKPVGRLWTAPLAEPASAWVFWAKKTGNNKTWRLREDVGSSAPIRESRHGVSGCGRLARKRRHTHRPEHVRGGRPQSGRHRHRTGRLFLAVRARSRMQCP